MICCSALAPTIAAERAASPEIEIFAALQRLGLRNAIDSLYSRVKVQYFFHLEDDWLFESSADWDRAIVLHEARQDGANVTVRAFEEIRPFGFRSQTFAGLRRQPY